MKILESTFENAKNASESAKDSRGWALFVICALVSLWDSRIVELESWLFVLFGGVELLAVGFG